MRPETLGNVIVLLKLQLDWRLTMRRIVKAQERYKRQRLYEQRKGQACAL